MSNQIRALGASLAAFPIFYVVAVLFGAPVFSHFWETATFAAVISLFTAIPLVLASDGDYNSLYRIAFLNDTRDLGKKQVALQRIAFGSLIGAWISCVVIPLDWDRWWQKWPLPCLFGTVFGSILGLLFSFVERIPAIRRCHRRFASNQRQKLI
ncbi:hypothetical protein L596_021199 [Steinernema carpocapsae]|uniref:Uncharacterized protein n=1 Tax=Steinernema carpocapsae TaxID=34508 RepID=A0A4U5MWU8_STECR|nr:hypothetical protein L596_021199 [Steinernema carpocapsae]